MEECLKNLRESLYVIMNKKNWSLLRLSIECEVSYRTMQAIMNDRDRGISLSTLIKISNGLNIPISSLIEDEEKRKGK